MQHSLEERMNRCKELNAAGKIAYRQAHNFAMISTVQQVLDSGNQTVRAAGARVVFYRIIFPGMVLEDKVYGKDGHLTLFASGWKATKSKGNMGETYFDVTWHVRIYEEKE